MPTCHTRSDCRLCGGTTLVTALSLASTPLANDFRPKRDLQKFQNYFPLEVLLCESCGHLQLANVVDPEALFEDYVYVSGTSPSFIAHFEAYARSASDVASLDAGDLVVDVGSNDGTLMKAFKALGARIKGVDPARNIANSANLAGLPTICDFFTEEIAKKIRAEEGCAKIITANNVCAHIDDLAGIVEAVKHLLAIDGIFVFEVSYLLDVLNNTLFDTIYHEHLDYHAVAPLIPFLKRHGMTLFHVERVTSHGGSIRVYAALEKKNCQPTAQLKRIIEIEREARLFSIGTYSEFSNAIETAGRKLRETLLASRRAGRKLAGYGAPAKATTLMHQFRLNRDDLAYIVDDSPWKQGLFSPGFNIPIVPPSHLGDEPVDDLLILAWNFAIPIIKNNRSFLERGGRFIVPLPELRLVTSDDQE